MFGFVYIMVYCLSYHLDYYITYYINYLGMNLETIFRPNPM